MNNSDVGFQPSDEVDFKAALELSAQLYDEGFFEIRPLSSGIAIALDSDEVQRALSDTELSLSDYRVIVYDELDLLLTSLISIGDRNALRTAPVLQDADDEDIDLLIARAEHLAEYFPIQQLQAEARTKRDQVTDGLGGISWQIVRPRGDDPAERPAPAAILRLDTRSPTPAYSRYGTTDDRGTRALSALLSAAGEKTRATFACTLSDIEYLMRHLKDIHEELKQAEQGNDDAEA